MPTGAVTPPHTLSQAHLLYRGDPMKTDNTDYLYLGTTDAIDLLERLDLKLLHDEPTHERLDAREAIDGALYHLVHHHI